MSDKNSSTVMLVDDEDIVVTSIQALLQLETAYRVLGFTSPEQALEVMQSEPVHVILADFMMPGMDGITFLTHARERCPMATRILLTGYADKQNAIRAINEAGLYFYLEKPWDNEELMMLIRNALERSRHLNELEARLSALEAAHEELAGIQQQMIRVLL